jgi:hypothetical protein
MGIMGGWDRKCKSKFQSKLNINKQILVFDSWNDVLIFYGPNSLWYKLGHSRIEVTDEIYTFKLSYHTNSTSQYADPSNS